MDREKRWKVLNLDPGAWKSSIEYDNCSDAGVRGGRRDREEASVGEAEQGNLSGALFAAKRKTNYITDTVGPVA